MNMNWTFGDVPSVLGHLADGRLVARASKVAAESYVDSVLDYIAAERPFVPRDGQAGAEAVSWRPDGDGAVVAVQAEHAVYLEEGTGLYGPKKQRYVIRPKPGREALRIPLPGGGYLFRKLIMHKGMKARPYFFKDFKTRQKTMLDAVRLDLLEQLNG
jgi:hypothetical protein